MALCARGEYSSGNGKYFKFLTPPDYICVAAKTFGHDCRYQDLFCAFLSFQEAVKTHPEGMFRSLLVWGRRADRGRATRNSCVIIDFTAGDTLPDTTQIIQKNPPHEHFKTRDVFGVQENLMFILLVFNVGSPTFVKFFFFMSLYADWIIIELAV